MAKTAVKIRGCGACGADVRDESLFCYNCGASVAAEQGTNVEELVEHSADPEPAAAKPAENVNRPPLRSAASLRKQRRASNRQPVRVSWEPPSGSPKAFVITTIVLSVAAAALLTLALYLR